MSLKKEVETILESQQRSLSWLATEMDKTFTGLKMSLVNESIKYSDLKKMIQILNVPIQSLFAGETSILVQKGGKHKHPGESLIYGE